MRPKELDALFQPLRVGNMTLKNRLVMAPMSDGFADKDGNVGERTLAFCAARAAGGVGMITTASASIDFPAGYLGLYELRVDTDAFIPGLARLAAAIKRQGAKASLQIVHAGPYARA